MERHAFIVIYGAPASGKTSLCRYIESTFKCYYADVANATARGGAMWKIASDQYTEHGEGMGLITEGVLAEREYRDRFCNKIFRAQKERVIKPNVFFLQESIDLLKHRRPGWERRFGDLEHEIGSEQFRHHIINGRKYPSLEMRAQFVMDKLGNAAPVERKLTAKRNFFAQFVEKLRARKT